jgi:hypothetical protein
MFSCASTQDSGCHRSCAWFAKIETVAWQSGSCYAAGGAGVLVQEAATSVHFYSAIRYLYKIPKKTDSHNRDIGHFRTARATALHRERYTGRLSHRHCINVVQVPNSFGIVSHSGCLSLIINLGRLEEATRFLHTSFSSQSESPSHKHLHVHQYGNVNTQSGHQRCSFFPSAPSSPSAPFFGSPSWTVFPSFSPQVHGILYPFTA